MTNTEFDDLIKKAGIMAINEMTKEDLLLIKSLKKKRPKEQNNKQQTKPKK